MKLRIKFLWRSWNFICLSARTKKSVSRWVSSLGERSRRVREVPGSNPNMSVFILYIRGDWPSILDTPRLIAQRTYVFLFTTFEVTENRSQIPLVWWHKCYHCATQTLSADFSCVIILSLLTWSIKNHCVALPKTWVQVRRTPSTKGWPSMDFWLGNPSVSVRRYDIPPLPFTSHHITWLLYI